MPKHSQTSAKNETYDKTQQKKTEIMMKIRIIAQSLKSMIYIHE